MIYLSILLFYMKIEKKSRVWAKIKTQLFIAGFLFINNLGVFSIIQYLLYSVYNT